jgi:enediyne biosynthesis protein E4
VNRFSGRARRAAPAIVALVAVTVAFFLVKTPGASASTRTQVAADYKFTKMPIAMPAGYRPTATIRSVNPAYDNVRSWISAVGAGIALTDLKATGRSDTLCIVDTRTNDVVVTYAPTAPTADRFVPFVLKAAPLPMNAAMAPMGCTPGDYNLDGRMDLMVTYWGRTPVMFLARSNATALSMAAYKPVEVIPSQSVDGAYHGAKWNTNAVNVADFDGTGQPDVLVANYFPDSDVLNAHGENNVSMNSSLSNAHNGGGAHMMRWYSATSGPDPTVQYVEDPDSIPFKNSTGWTLALSSADLTGDGKPEIYIANDFGKDYLLYNRSTKGHIRFTSVHGDRTPTTPKSFVIGKSSFKGMGIDFADLNHDGRFDMVVSNITTAWGLEESNFAWMNKATSDADMAAQLQKSKAPFRQEANQMGLAFTGWGWDVKAADFRNSGQLDIVQAEGFVKGAINRWPWLQEMAMNNDNVFTNPSMWPKVQPGDDLAGKQPFAFYAKDAGGKYVNINHELGMAQPTPSRGIAMADTRGTGVTDFAIARQWGAPDFFANNTPGQGKYLDLHLYQPLSGGTTTGGLQLPGAPAYGATVELRTADGRTTISKLDGGSGHSGKRSFNVHFGLGQDTRPVTATVMWCDGAGGMHVQALDLAPGAHSLLLSSTAKEVPNS